MFRSKHTAPNSSSFVIPVPLFSLIFVVTGFFFGCGGPEYPNCDTDGDCRSGEFCVNGVCQNCRDDNDCPSGHECIAGRCDPIENHCTSSDDCAAGETCQNNRCVALKQTLAPTETTTGCAIRPLYFDFDSSNIKSGNRDKLTENAECVRQKSAKKLNLTGYADPRGTEEYNLALGDRRARSTQKYLKSLGLEVDIHPMSMGEEMARGIDEASWAKDRRVEFQLQ